MMMEHFGGQDHFRDINELMDRLVMGAGGRMGAILARGGDEDVLLAHRCAHFMRCHESGEIVVINMLTWDYVELGVCMEYISMVRNLNAKKITKVITTSKQ